MELPGSIEQYNKFTNANVIGQYYRIPSQNWIVGVDLNKQVCVFLVASTHNSHMNLL
jgi:hypothetical protein